MIFALGTAQFGNVYGVCNRESVIGLNQVKNILSCAYELGIRVIDTAATYGRSQKFVGEALKQLSLNTVCSLNIKLDTSNITSKSQLTDRFNDSLKELGVESADCLCLHSTKLLINHNMRMMVVDFLLSQKEQEKIKSIGVSIYTSDEASLVMKMGVFDIIQLPLSIVAQALRKNNLFEDLSKHKIEIHARSIFLQGLLLSRAASDRFVKAHGCLAPHEYWSYLDKTGISPLHACLSFIKQQKVFLAVIGVDNVTQLEEIVSTSKMEPIITDFHKFSHHDSYFTDPRSWTTLA